MTPPEKYVRRYTSVSAIIDTLACKRLTLLSPEIWDDRNDRYFMALYREKKGLKRLSAMCATHVTETYHHWRVFSGMSDGACIVIRRAKLETALKRLDGVRFGNVDYLKLPELQHFPVIPGNIDKLPFIKRWAFKDEGEYRVTFESMADGDEPYHIAIEASWIDKVVLNPWMPTPFVGTIRSLLKGLDGFHGLKVQQSHLINSKTWQSLGDKIIGAHKGKLAKPH